MKVTGISPGKRAYYNDLLNRVYSHPTLAQDSISLDCIHENEEILQEVFEVIFPFALTHNEIKAVALPFQEFVFNSTERFRNIVKDSNQQYEITWRDFDQHKYYIMCCCIIMNLYFKRSFDLNRPLLIDLPNKDGVVLHYRVLYNADFVGVSPNENARMLSQQDCELLADNYHDFELWQSYFPQQSWNLKGFGLVSMIDVTTENATANLKEILSQIELKRLPIGQKLTQAFCSIFRIANLKVGYTHLEQDFLVNSQAIESIGIVRFLFDSASEQIVLSQRAHQRLVQDKECYTISDMDVFVKEPENKKMAEHLKKHSIMSCILSPVIMDGKTVGVLEIVSTQSRVLNSVNAQKLESVMNIVAESFKRTKASVENHVEAIIQREFTSIHPSVYWRFLQEGYNTHSASFKDKSYIIDPIIFSNVFPLFGEIDIQSSSKLRNQMIEKDLCKQLESLIELLHLNHSQGSIKTIDRYVDKLSSFLIKVQSAFASGLEQKVEHYIKDKIHPFLFKDVTNFHSPLFMDYIKYIDYEHEIYYRYRKTFDLQIQRVNKVFSDLLDQRQIAAQQVFPHYYERFKTDGVEHNIYIGQSINDSLVFKASHLQYIKLWQLVCLAELVCVHYRNNKQDEISMETTSLIFVHDTPLSIQFRLDEKKFDVAGAYDTRFEIIKKRLDKAYQLGTKERIVQKKSICIAFASKKDVLEYTSFIEYGKSIGLFLPDLEYFEIENLQGVNGLVALRVRVNVDFQIETLDYVNLLSNYLNSGLSV